VGEDVNADLDDECPGEGKCHGCLSFCNNCGDVGHVCDTRLAGGRCDAHPIPPEWGELRKRRREAEKKLLEATRLDREARKELDAIRDDEIARNEYTKQRHREENEMFGIKNCTCADCKREQFNEAVVS
jgi:hypothetical protein